MSELTWEQEQDINGYLGWKIDNDWATKGHTIMPQTMIEETTVYTIEELEALGWSVHETAMIKVREWNWESWEPSFYSDDVKSFIGEEFSLFYLEDHTLEWSTDPNWIHGKGSIDILPFMKAHKLCNKFRSLWYLIRTEGIHVDAPTCFGFGYDLQTDLSDLRDETEYFVTYNSARYWKIDGEINRLRCLIDAYMDEMETRLLKNLRAEVDYQYSDEYAKETIESYELRFTEDGEIYH